jgi:cytidylate kinase
VVTRSRVIAIDGPAGAGKSTVSRALARRLGLHYLDTGAMYRAVTYAALRDRLDPADQERVGALARATAIFVGDPQVLVDGDDVTTDIRSAEVNAAVSVVAANPQVRAELREQQRAWAAERGGGVIEGRDIGSVVFPNAELKVHLTASAEERARRRTAESGGDAGAIADNLRLRDHIDSTRSDSPLREADGSVLVDTDGRTIEQVVDAIVALLESSVSETSEVGSTE